MEFHFKRGVYRLNPQSNFDFQLNRLVMWDGGDLEEVREAGAGSGPVRTGSGS